MNKVALVTGASSLFGKQVAQKLKVSGFKVFAAAKQVDRVEDLKANGIIPLSMDLAKEDSIQQCVNQILSESGSIDVLVNNVSYGPLGAVEHFPMEEARRQFDINLFGTARVIQLVTPEMRFKRSGKIVNVSFMNGTVWTEMGVWYHSLKHAVDGFFDCLAPGIGVVWDRCDGDRSRRYQGGVGEDLGGYSGKGTHHRSVCKNVGECCRESEALSERPNTVGPAAGRSDRLPSGHQSQSQRSLCGW